MRSSRTLTELVLAALIGAYGVTPRATVTPEQIDGIYKLDRSGQTAGGWHVTSTLTLTAPDYYELETVVRTRGEEKEELENGRFGLNRGGLFLTSDKREREAASFR